MEVGLPSIEEGRVSNPINPNSYPNPINPNLKPRPHQVEEKVSHMEVGLPSKEEEDTALLAAFAQGSSPVPCDWSTQSSHTQPLCE